MGDNAAVPSVALPTGFAARINALWGRWWALPLLAFPTYSSVMIAIGDLRPEHMGITLVVWILAVIGPRSKRFLVDISPYFVVALGYDLVRYARPVFVSADRVLGCQLRSAEVSLFGFGTGHTPGDWLQGHHVAGLDLFFAVPYTVFIYVAFIYAAYLYVVDRQRMRRFLWAFAIANYMSFTLWMIVPAAPPWYLREAGCAIDMSAVPSAAGLLRVDRLLGIDYFHTFYSRAASVYGAMPSMHCAYPVLGLFSAWKYTTWKTRPLHLFYAAWMFCAAIYLDHHWILDALAGWAVAAVAVFLAGRLTARLAPPERATSEATAIEEPGKLEVRHEHA